MDSKNNLKQTSAGSLSFKLSTNPKIEYFPAIKVECFCTSPVVSVPLIPAFKKSAFSLFHCEPNKKYIRLAKILDYSIFNLFCRLKELL